jgi:hypothetical protein
VWNPFQCFELVASDRLRLTVSAAGVPAWPDAGKRVVKPWKGQRAANCESADLPSGLRAKFDVVGAPVAESTTVDLRARRGEIVTRRQYGCERI